MSLRWNQNDVERRYAIHENRLASVKASLSLTTPLRLDFMDKRLSKNYHIRRHHAQVVHENLKLLRALEQIHSRRAGGCGSRVTDDTVFPAGGGAASKRRRSGTAGQGPGAGTGSSMRSAGGGKSNVRTRLNTLLARKRDLKAAFVARENEKMMEVSMYRNIVFCAWNDGDNIHFFARKSSEEICEVK